MPPDVGAHRVRDQIADRQTGAHPLADDLQWPRKGSVAFGDLRRVTPVSTKFGLDRGRAIDRYYIEGFLADSAEHIRGRCLELGDAYYTNTLGGERVTQEAAVELRRLCAPS